MAKRGRKPKANIRITLAGGLPKRTELIKAKAKRRAARERQSRRPPVEDDRVTRAWERKEMVDAAKADAFVAYRIAKSKPALTIETKKIDDPYAQKRGDKLLADVNVNESPVEWLYARRRLTTLQYTVASKFRGVYERSTVGNVQAIDYEKPMVEGAVPGDIFSDELVAANFEVKAIGRVLGRVSTDLLVRIAGIGERIEVIAEGYAQPGVLSQRLAQGYVTERFREALDELAKHWKMAEASGPSRSRGIGSLHGAPLIPGYIDYDEEIQTHDMRGA